MLTQNNQTPIQNIISTLYKNGYKFHNADYRLSSVGLFQKVIAEGYIKSYYINITQYEIDNRTYFHAEVHLYLPDETMFEASRSIYTVDDIEKVEKFFADIYSTFNCIPDVHNN